MNVRQSPRAGRDLLRAPGGAEAVSGVEPEAADSERDGSHDALLLTEALREASRAPDVRARKVAELRAKIAANEYRIDNALIAGALVREEMDFLS